jgi:hypothetical protein
MIRVLMLDLGDTLVHDRNVFPHACEALETIASFETAAGEPLATCLVSDYHMPSPPPTQEKIEAIFQEFISILDGCDLTRFFEPVMQRVTLSTHAGVRKPNRHIFEMALHRLALPVGLSECLFITENTDHISACQKLGMKTLRFDHTGSRRADFSDWSEAPLLIARMISSPNSVNIEPALKIRLATAHGIELTSIKRRLKDGRIQARAKRWYPISTSKRAKGKGQDIYLPLAIDVEIRLDEQGRIRSVKSSQPAPEALAEAAKVVETLEANQQLAYAPGPLPPGATHQLETDAEGRWLLKRRRFSAI